MASLFGTDLLLFVATHTTNGFAHTPVLSCNINIFPCSMMLFAFGDVCFYHTRWKFLAIFAANDSSFEKNPVWGIVITLDLTISTMWGPLTLCFLVDNPI